MKRPIVSILLVVIAIICLVACSTSNGDTTSQTYGSVIEDTTSKTAEATTTEIKDPSTQHTHVFGEWITVKNATCTDNGEQERTCLCGETETQTVAATGHTEVKDAAVAATCTENGKTEGSHCSVCGEVIKKQETISAKGHSFGEWTVLSLQTCITNGNKTRKCAVCGTAENEVISSTGHNWKAATCTSAKTCKKCGATKGTPLGHNYVSGKCSICGESQGIWSVGQYVDEFQALTGDKYVYAKVEGTFSNSATTNSRLTVEIIADKLREDDPNHIDFYLFLYEYGSQLVKSSYSDQYYNITMKDSSGKKTTFTTVVLAGGDRLLLENVYEPLVLESLRSGGTTSFYIEEDGHTITNYLFSIESSNFATVIKKLG